MLFVSLCVAAVLAEPKDLSAELEVIRRDHDVSSMVCAAYRDGELLGSGAAGSYSYEEVTPVTTQSKYHIGSCTKAMTAVLVGMMVDEGALVWDTPIATALDGLVDEPNKHYYKVTIRDLLGHRAGIDANRNQTLMRLPGMLSLAAEPISMREQRRKIAELILSTEPQIPGGDNGEYAYSNHGYILAGVILEQHYDKPWEDLIHERIFEPLGMESAGFGPPGESGKMTEPVGHIKRDGWQPMKIIDGQRLPDNPASFGPAGTVHANIIDWGKFVDDYAQGLDGKGELLNTESYEAIISDNDGDSYALGWGVAQRPWADGLVLNHSGSNTYWFCVTWTAPEKDLVMVCASNVPPNPGSTACDAAIGMMVGRFAEKLETTPPAGE
jgi:CubicO group peptidase (beta-lactamase class C family)